MPRTFAPATSRRGELRERRQSLAVSFPVGALGQLLDGRLLRVGVGVDVLGVGCDRRALGPLVLGPHIDDLDGLRALATAESTIERIEATPDGWVYSGWFAHCGVLDDFRSFWREEGYPFRIRRLTRDDGRYATGTGDAGDGLTTARPSQHSRELVDRRSDGFHRRLVDLRDAFRDLVVGKDVERPGAHVARIRLQFALGERLRCERDRLVALRRRDDRDGVAVAKNGRLSFETTRYGRTPLLNVAGARTTLPCAYAIYAFSPRSGASSAHSSSP